MKSLQFTPHIDMDMYASLSEWIYSTFYVFILIDTNEAVTIIEGRKQRT